MTKRFLSLLLILPMLAFCAKKNEEPEKTDPAIAYEGELEITVGSAAGSGTLTFTCNTDWTVESGNSWLTVSPESGVASKEPATITYTYQQTDRKKNRSTDIVISGKGTGLWITIIQVGDPMAGAAPEIKNGDAVLATNHLVEKFLTEVNYPDKTYTEYTKIFDYYGGFDGTNFTWSNWGKEWPDGDIPEQYSIRWTEDKLEKGKMKLHLADKLGWEGDMDIDEGSLYVNITNLVPNDEYNYRVTAASGIAIFSACCVAGMVTPSSEGCVPASSLNGA